MALYLYGVVAAPVDYPPTLTKGVDGAQARFLEFERLGALVSDLPEVAYRARKGDLLAHSDVLQEVVASTDVLPMRFGTVFESRDDLVEEFLAPNEEELVSLLRHLEGAVEVQIKADYDADALAMEILSTDRALQKLQARAKARGDVESSVEVGRRFATALDECRRADRRKVVGALDSFARDAIARAPGGEYGAFNVSFLVTRDQLGRFDDGIERLQASMRPSIELRCVGPLPPYSFVEAEAVGAR